MAGFLKQKGINVTVGVGRVVRKRALLDPPHMQDRSVEIDLIPAEVADLGRPETVAEGDQDHGRVPVPMAVGLGRLDQDFDLARRQVLPGPKSDWVLTTYETLRDYHLSFAAVPFSCVVFDEMQKVKSPTSLLTRAAKTVNAEFTLGLTGTPIENHLAVAASICHQRFRRGASLLR
jgi:SNF2-related domain